MNENLPVKTTRKDMLILIRAFYDRHGRPPTIAELGAPLPTAKDLERAFGSASYALSLCHIPVSEALVQKTVRDTHERYETAVLNGVATSLGFRARRISLG